MEPNIGTLQMRIDYIFHELYKLQREWAKNVEGKGKFYTILRGYFAKELLREVERLREKVDTIKYVEVK